MTNVIMSTQVPKISPFREFERNRNGSVQGFSSKHPHCPKKDLLLDTPVRYLAYTNEIGEAVRPLVAGSKGILKKIPVLSYVPALGYIAADAIDKFKKGEDGTGKKPSLKTGVRELGFQAVTSVLAPTAVVKTTQKLIGKAIEHLPKKLSASHTKAAQVAGAMVALFALAKPIDKITDKCFEKIVDPLIGIKKHHHK